MICPKRCQMCPNAMSPTAALQRWAKHPTVVMIGEAPGRSEATRGIPFVGRSGQLLRPLVKDICTTIGVSSKQLAFTNAVACWPTDDGRRNRKPNADEISACSERLLCELKEMSKEEGGVRKYPKVIALGSVACSALGVKFRKFADVVDRPHVGNVGGVELEVYALYHPAYILRSGAYEAYKVSVERALRWAFDAEEDKAKYDVPFTYITTVKGWMEHREKVIAGTRYVVDIETTGLNLTDKITLLALRNVSGVYLVPSDMLKKKIVLKDVFDILSSRRVIFHNAPFDLSMLHRFFARYEMYLPLESMCIEDTLAMHSVLDEVGVAGTRGGDIERSTGGHGLKALVRLYLGVDYGDEVDWKRGIQSEEDHKNFLAYAARDVEYTWRLYDIFKQQFTAHDRKLYAYFKEIQPLLVRMRLWGIYIDWKQQKKLKEQLTRTKKELLKTLRGIARNDEFNPNSYKQVGGILFGMWGLPPVKVTESGNFSTDNETLTTLLGRDNLTHEQREFMEKLLEFRSTAKMLSTYVESLEALAKKRDDKRVETRWNPYGTVTRRWTSSPNMQNIPHYSAYADEIRRMYAAPPGKVFLSIDAKQIELGVFAALAEDEVWMKAYSNGVDLHTATAESLFGLQFKFATPEDKKLLRQKAKRVNFAVLYGQSADSLAQDLGISVEEARRLLHDFHRTHPSVQEYRNKLLRQAHQAGRVVCEATGAVRRVGKMPPKGTKEYEEVVRHLGNCHIQGTAGIMTAMVAARLAKRWHTAGVEIPLIVHDEINFYTPIELVDDIVEDTRRQFAEVSKEVLAGRVIIDIDAEVGYNWYDVKPIEEFLEEVYS